MLFILAYSTTEPFPLTCSNRSLILEPEREGLRHLELLDELHGGEAGGAGAGAEGRLEALQLARPRPARVPRRAHQQRLQQQEYTFSAPQTRCPQAINKPCKKPTAASLWFGIGLWRESTSSACSSRDLQI